MFQIELAPISIIKYKKLFELFLKKRQKGFILFKCE